MTANNGLKLLNFFIFNPELSKSEGEEEKKILYYYPNDTPSVVQVKSAGLCEAVVKFAASFNPDKPCHMFATAKTKQVLFTLETDFWMAMTISAKDNEVTNGDPSDVIADKIFSSMLELSYKIYFLFNGSLKLSIDSEGSDGLSNRLQQFFNSYLPSMPIEDSNLLDVFNGIQYLPLGRDQFLHVQSFINTVECNFTCIRHSVFLYNDHLIWSGIDPSDMQVVYQYLVKKLLAEHPDLELQGATLPGNLLNYGSFITGPSSLDDPSATTEVPVVHLSCASGVTKYHLVVYRALSATICLLIPEASALTLNTFQMIEAFVGPRLTTLVSEISEHCVRSSAGNLVDSNARFIYFNKLNMAVKHSLDSKKSGGASLSPEILQLLASLNADRSVCCDNRELMLKYPNDTWVVMKCSNGREVYFVTHKKPSVRDLTTDVKKICNTQLKGIFFMS